MKRIKVEICLSYIWAIKKETILKNFKDMDISCDAEYTSCSSCPQNKRCFLNEDLSNLGMKKACQKCRYLFLCGTVSNE